MCPNRPSDLHTIESVSARTSSPSNIGQFETRLCPRPVRPLCTDSSTIAQHPASGKQNAAEGWLRSTARLFHLAKAFRCETLWWGLVRDVCTGFPLFLWAAYVDGVRLSNTGRLDSRRLVDLETHPTRLNFSTAEKSRLGGALTTESWQR